MKLEENLGQQITLPIVKEVEFGVYLGDQDEQVLLPKKQVPEEAAIGDEVDVFIYRDSSDRLIATTNVPKIQLGELKILEVIDTGRIGAFLDWGLEKDLLLPFKEQTKKVQKGDQVLVALYVDKSGRLCATMRVYSRLHTDSPYKKDDIVNGTIFDKSEKYGVFVAVDNYYSAMIPSREVYGDLEIGTQIKARVSRVREDGKLDLSVRKKAYQQMNDDAELILARMDENGGMLPFTDKADPALIRQELGLSKNAFKRAVGRLLKDEKVQIRGDCIMRV